MSIRIATRAVIVKDQRLLLVNAFPGQQSDLWCAPGGGAEVGASLPDNLQREVFEETGLRVKPDSLAHVAFARGMGYDPLEVLIR
ncbi:NUDIX domain-containing protein [Roseovarius marisflavi]|uniref:NUDIX domain-containing protein n=1 Tax=Roseovarius marisflavi TaxID=1054996 RepID=UPI00093297F7|nr:NUDIX domain-containing protein [Roseovarius marisflavi]